LTTDQQTRKKLIMASIAKENDKTIKLLYCKSLPQVELLSHGYFSKIPLYYAKLALLALPSLNE